MWKQFQKNKIFANRFEGPFLSFLTQWLLYNLEKRFLIHICLEFLFMFIFFFIQLRKKVPCWLSIEDWCFNSVCSEISEQLKKTFRQPNLFLADFFEFLTRFLEMIRDYWLLFLISYQIKLYLDVLEENFILGWWLWLLFRKNQLNKFIHVK